MTTLLQAKPSGGSCFRTKTVNEDLKAIKVRSLAILQWTVIILFLTSCDGRVGPTVDVKLAFQQATTLNNAKEWAGLWEKVGNGEVTELGTLELANATKAAALEGLVYVLREDTKQPVASQWNEKHFLPIIDKVFNDNGTYYQAYAELALHASNRDPKVGQFMYTQVPKEPAVLDKLTSATAMLTFFYRNEFEEVIPYSTAILDNDSSGEEEKGLARIVDLVSRKNLGHDNACEKILATSEEQLLSDKHRKTLQKLKEQCRTSSASGE